MCLESISRHYRTARLQTTLYCNVWCKPLNASRAQNTSNKTSASRCDAIRNTACTIMSAPTPRTHLSDTSRIPDYRQQYPLFRQLSPILQSLFNLSSLPINACLLHLTSAMTDYKNVYSINMHRINKIHRNTTKNAWDNLHELRKSFRDRRHVSHLSNVQKNSNF